jgi:hypothetical protein
MRGVAELIRRNLIAIVASVVGLGFASPALAQDDDGDTGIEDLIVLTGRLVVPEAETVATAVVFNGDATIDGTVTEALIVVNGRAEISGTVGEDVVVFNGRAVVRTGADVGGDVVSRAAPVIEDGATVGGDVRGIATRFDIEDLGVAGRIAWWIGYSVSTLLLGLLLLLFAPALDPAITDVVRRRFGAAVGIGAAVFFLVPIAAVILMVVIVAIPLGLFVLLGLALLYTIGYVTGAHALGRLLVKPPGSRFAAFLAGLGILRLVALVPIVGGLAWLLASIVGLGLLTVAARRTPSETLPATPAPPPPTPALT